jgi:hypothetical protein
MSAVAPTILDYGRIVLNFISYFLPVVFQNSIRSQGATWREDGRLDHINTKNPGSVGQSALDCQGHCLSISPPIIFNNKYFQ